ncbi:MAG: hypothetical protein AAF745_16535 [Planctomycetota bacterium]
MSRRQSIELGHDAFLDIVANLVGILIILVVVLGAQTKQVQTALLKSERELKADAQQREDAASAPATANQLKSLERSIESARSAMKESLELEAKVNAFDQRIEAARQQRDQLMDLVTVARLAWEDKQSELDADFVMAAKLKSELDEATSKLAELAGVKTELENRKPPTVSVEHLPTPMAKTVFGDELHFRLHQGHLSVVPIEQLLTEMESDLRRTLNSNRQGQKSSSVGPIRGYVAHFDSLHQIGRIAVDGKVTMGKHVRLAQVRFEPLEEPAGQRLDVVLSDSSMLDVELAGRNPETTTITVWVYPDQFAGLRSLREHLYRRGFATAARPLETGSPITGGPGGRKSRSQ